MGVSHIRLGLPHAANHGKLVGKLGRPREQLRKVNSRNRRRYRFERRTVYRVRIWFGVPRVGMRYSALLKDDQHALRLSTVRLSRDGVLHPTGKATETSQRDTNETAAIELRWGSQH